MKKPQQAPTKPRDNEPCPSPKKGEECWLCGAKYICRDPWRKKAKENKS